MQEEFATHPRPGRTKISVITSDGKSNRESNRTIPAAVKARAQGVEIFVIGITDSVEEEELRLMSSEPQVEGANFWLAPTFDALDKMYAAVTGEICSARIPGEAFSTCWPYCRHAQKKKTRGANKNLCLGACHHRLSIIEVWSA